MSPRVYRGGIFMNNNNNNNKIRDNTTYHISKNSVKRDYLKDINLDSPNSQWMREFMKDFKLLPVRKNR